jgi:hypothetical protein
MDSHNELMPYPDLPTPTLEEGQSHGVILSGELIYLGQSRDVARLILNSISFPMVSIGNLN